MKEASLENKNNCNRWFKSIKSIEHAGLYNDQTVVLSLPNMRSTFKALPIDTRFDQSQWSTGCSLPITTILSVFDCSPAERYLSE